jgi:hypothetical protein
MVPRDKAAVHLRRYPPSGRRILAVEEGDAWLRPGCHTVACAPVSGVVPASYPADDCMYGQTETPNDGFRAFARGGQRRRSFSSLSGGSSLAIGDGEREVASHSVFSRSAFRTVASSPRREPCCEPPGGQADELPDWGDLYRYSSAVTGATAHGLVKFAATESSDGASATTRVSLHAGGSEALVARQSRFP